MYSRTLLRHTDVILVTSAFHCLYMGWQWRHYVYNSYRRHVGGMLCCSNITS